MKRAEGYVDSAGKHFDTAAGAIDSDLEINIIELLGATSLNIPEEMGVKRLIGEGRHRVALRKILNQHAIDLSRHDYTLDGYDVDIEG